MPCDDYLLKFPQKYMRIRRSRHIYLLVAVDPSVNLVSLRMVTNLVLKHITPKVLSVMRSQIAACEQPPNTPTPAAPAPTEEPAVSTPTEPTATRGNKVARPRPTRSFRGTRY